tara:strand:+ start:977 stop:1876 length:900 start_codon:yes stop_codon:yes gene_type:complete
MKVIPTILPLQKNLQIIPDSLRKYAILLLFIISCNYNLKNNDGYVARVGDEFLSVEEIQELIPKNLNKQDSIRIVNNVIEEWATSKLLIQNAIINLTEIEKSQIDNKSEKYRENLIISEYRNKISNNNPDTSASKDEIELFFSENSKNFKLFEEIIKGRYVKLNKNTFNINEIKRRFRRFNQSDKSFFDSISIQLLNYYLNDSIWINKKLFFNKIPSLEYDQSLRISKNNLFYVQEDSLALYLIKINNYKKADDYAPLEYIYNRIKEVIVSKKRIDYLNKIDKELIGDAITKNLYERLD